ncbi:MAG: hypothetical protein DMG24_19015 [Acidobacteria bacterium]|nr:MAG: hypothetical protein DMG24_19015 [Acidobacteriota bacterium]
MRATEHRPGSARSLPARLDARQQAGARLLGAAAREENQRPEVPASHGYRGFIALAHRTGKVSSIYPAIVHQRDQFSLKLGTGRQLVHAPVLDPAKRGDWIGAYAVVEFRDGRTDFEWMTRKEIEKVKQCSDSASEAWSPWRRFEDEMIKKSPIRRMAKRLCLSSEDMTLVEAAVRDEYREMGSRNPKPLLPPSVSRKEACRPGGGAAAARSRGAAAEVGRGRSQAEGNGGRRCQAKARRPSLRPRPARPQGIMKLLNLFWSTPSSKPRLCRNPRRRCPW